MDYLKNHTEKLMLLSVIIFFTATSYSQESLNDKIESIKGNVEKITVTADGTEYTFEGKDAEKLFKKLQSKEKSINTFVLSSDDDENGVNKIIIKSDGDEKLVELKCDKDHNKIWFSDDEHETDGLNKEINVEVENGKKKVTVTTKENGEEKTEIYEGKEAEEYLEKMKSENKNCFKFNREDEDGKKIMKFKIEVEDEEDDSE